MPGFSRADCPAVVMQRRDFGAIVAGALVLRPLLVRAQTDAPLERYGIPILLLLLLLGGGIGASIISSIADPVRELLMKVFVGS